MVPQRLESEASDPPDLPEVSPSHYRKFQMKKFAYLNRAQIERNQAREDAAALAKLQTAAATLEACGLLGAAAGLNLSARADRLLRLKPSARTYANLKR